MTYLTTNLTDQKTNIAFQKTTVTSSQNVSSSWALVEGGQMSYTPSSSSAKVMVEFTTAYSRKDPDNSVIFKLQIADSNGDGSINTGTLGDIVTGNIDYHNSFGTTSTNNVTNQSNNITLKYILDGWSGKKYLQVQCSTYNNSSSLESRVNGTRDREASTEFVYNPFMFIYEVQ
tara:strand:+ start:3220 stop:3741 length:522 start_codon:yes stop_codon:yes gene_type:complete